MAWHRAAHAACRSSPCSPGSSPDPRALTHPTRHLPPVTWHIPCLQEIAGHEEMVGQYESYKSFTMPQLYRVVEVRAGLGR